MLAAATAVFALSLSGLAAPAMATPPIWEPNFGSTIAAITNSDDAATEIPLETFSFPFYGTTYTGTDAFGVSSNGLIAFNEENTQNIPSGEEARTGAPKIAALWADLNPTIVGVDQGDVFMNTFNDDGDPSVDRVVFTWDSAFFGCENQPGCRARAQVQLFESGRIVFGYDGVLTNQAANDFGGNTPLQPTIARGGFSKPAGFVAPPPGLDLSEAVPFTSGDLIFETFFSDPIRFDLDQNNLVIDPVGPAGYQVASTVPFSRVPGASGAPESQDTSKPKAKLKAGKQDLGKVLSKGLKLQLSCNEACFAEVKVASKSPKVKNAGGATVELAKSGKSSVTVGLNGAARSALKGKSSAKLTVTAVVFDESGNKSKVKKTVNLK